MGTPSPSDSRRAVEASTSTQGTGRDLTRRNTCLSLAAAESLLQDSRQEPSISAHITEAARRSTSAGRVSTMLASRGWQMPWKRAARTFRAHSSDSV